MSSTPTDPPAEAGPITAAPDASAAEDPVAFTKNMEQDSWRQAERHATAAGFWGNFQWVAGGLSAVLAAAASGSAFSDNTTAAGLLALGASASAALVTALRPGDISTRHMQSAAAANPVQASSRDLWEFGRSDDAPARRAPRRGLTSTWVDVTAGSPRVPRRLLKLTAEFTQRGENYYPPPSA
jgi:hypothetical protein